MGPTAGAPSPMTGVTQPNLLERSLPTMGGILGGVAGLPANLLDAVGIPGTVGDVAMAGGGAALGKSLEDRLTGQPGGNGVLGAGAAGAAGQGIGEGVGSILGHVGSLLGKFGTNLIGKSAAKDAIDTTLQKATATKNNYGSLTPKVQQAWKLGTNQKFVDQMGFDSSDPYQMRAVANAGYKLNDTVDNALKGVSVDTSKVTNPALELAKNGRLGSPEGEALLRAYQSSNIPLGPGGELPPTLPAANVRQLTQSLGNEMGDKDLQIAQVERNGLDASTLKSQRADLQTVRDDLVKTLNTSDGANANIKGASVNPQILSQLTAKYGEPLATHISNIINSAQSYSDIVPEMQRFAQMGKISNTAIDDIENATGTRRAEARVAAGAKEGQPQSAASHIVEGASHLMTGNKAGTIKSILSAVGQNGGPITEKMGGILEGTSKLMKKPLGAAGVATATAPNFTGGGMTPTAAMIPGQGAAPPMAGGVASPEALQMMLGLIGMQADPYMASVFAPMISGATQPLQKAQTAQSALSGLQNQYALAGGGQGGVGGFMSKLASLIPGSAGNQYQKQAGQLESTLQGLGVPGTAAPSILAGGPTAQGQFGLLQAIIQALGGQSAGGVLSTVPSQ